MMNPDWSFPYPSQRMPVFANNVVATSQPLAAQAGLEVLRDGGNAIDAALATAITLTIVEPTSNGIGSDAFALIWSGGKLHGFNGSGRSPAALGPERFAGADAYPLSGWDTVTVPGAVDTWRQVHDRFGRMEFRRLFARAIQYAERGFPVSPITARAWAGSVDRLGAYEDWRKYFLSDGKTPAAGEIFHHRDAAETLRIIAETKGEDFYHGALAKKIAAHSERGGALLTEADLGSHKGDWVTPISLDYNGYIAYEIPPNGQGIATLIALGIIRELGTLPDDPDSTESLHLQIEAMKLALSDAYTEVADIEAMRLTPADLLSADRFIAHARRIDKSKAINPGELELQKGGTVLLTAADSEGNMVSFIQSNFWGFGSGIVVPDTGIALQNRGHGFVLKEGHPNRVAGGKRPFHTIIPGFVTKDGEPVLAYGLMGGSMQAQGHFQLLLRMIQYRQNPQAASDAPRWQVLRGGRIGVEPTMRESTVTGLRRLGHDVEVLAPSNFGGAQLILRQGSAYCGASDSRKDGCAVGF